MRLISIQGHFGCFAGEKITFEEGFCRRILPNGWGKSTLCAFVRVMLYGLNTSRRDTAAALSDKTAYLPHSGQAMSGRLEVEYAGRRIIICRSTSRGGPMQDFEAFFADSGEPCDFLNAKNCGETLLGVSEEVFRASAFIDGSEMMRPSAELGEKLRALAQTGDVQARGSQAAKRLERWRLDFDSGNGHGVLPDLAAQRGKLDKKLQELDALEAEAAEAAQENERLAAETKACEEAYETAYRTNAGEKADEQNRLTILRKESERRIAVLRAGLPGEETIRRASDALFSYEGAVRLEKEKREVLPPAMEQAQLKMQAIEKERRAEEIANNRRQRPKVSWALILLGLLLALAAAGSAVFGTDWGNLPPKMPQILSGLAVLSIFFAFLGSVPRREEPSRDYDGEKEKLENELHALEREQQMAASVLADAYDGLIAAAAEIGPVQTIEEAADLVRDKRGDLQALRREQDRLQDILMQLKRVRPGDAANEEGRRVLEEKRTHLRAAQKAEQAGVQTLFRLQGRMQAIGTREALNEALAALGEEERRARAQYESICTALSVLRACESDISARIAPNVAARAAEFLRQLTGGALTEVQLDTALSARAAGEDGRLHGPLQLSTGMRDQLYLAFRLAVCETLPADEAMPLILDDPFTTFDAARTAYGEALLRQLSEHRQVILLCNK